MTDGPKKTDGPKLTGGPEMADGAEVTDTWLATPQPVSDSSLPARVQVYEVGPRDGLQAETQILSPEVKIEYCRRLIATGVTALEVTSFVPPSWIPQLADAEEVLAGFGRPESSRSISLVPNVRGLERSRAAGVTEVAIVASSTESFARANLNKDLSGALRAAEEVIADAATTNTPVRGYLSMAFGDPWEGPVPLHTVVALATRLYEAGCSTIALGDTIGVATPNQVSRTLEAVFEAGVPADRIALHLHDTYGMALANVRAALSLGINEFDSAAGGIGRCPYAKGATGNLATEDLVWMLHGMGIETGIDLEAMVQTSQWMSAMLGKPVPSRVVTARTAAAK
jgi:hydroxymethylglutaryl-CoA lyase